MPLLPRRTAARLALGLTLLAAGPAAAQTWNSTTDRNWGVAGNWTPATIPNAATAVAVFGGTGPGAINFATGGAAFTVNAVNFTAGGYTLDAAGTLTWGGTAPALTNTTGTNVINSRLVAANLAAAVSGGTLTLNNVRGAAANSLTGTSVFTVTNNGTLDVALANADAFNGTNTSSALSEAAVTLNGGTLNLRGNLVAGGLTGQVYPVVGPGGNLANINNTHPDFVTTGGNLSGTPRNRSLFNLFNPEILGAPNAGSTAAIDRMNTFTSQANGQTFAAIGSAQNLHFLSRWSGVVNIPTTGNYVFGTRSDDGSLIYVDGTQVANNNFYQGMTTRTVTVNALTAGAHNIDIYFYGGGGGNGLLAGFVATPGNLGTSDASIQANAFPAATTFGRQGTINLAAGNVLNVSGTSTINLTHVNDVRAPSLNLSPAANLTLGGNNGLLRAAFTNLTGTGTRSFTLNATGGDLAVGQLTTNAGAVTLVKTGVGNLIFDGTTAPNLGGGTITYDVQNGRLVGVSDNTIPFATNILGDAAVVRLNGSAGNTAIFQMRTRIGEATFDAAIQVQGTGGVIEALPVDQSAFSNFQLGSGTRGITLTAGTLTFDVFGGGDGANVEVPGPITGSGNLAMANGTGFLTILSNNAARTGTTTISAGTLIQTQSQSVGTGNITVNAGGTFGLRGDITVNNAISINGGGSAGRSGALEATLNALAANTNPVYGGAVTLAGNATIGMGADSIVSSFSVNGAVNLGANTLTLNAAGGSSDTSFLQVNGVVSGTGNLAKTGPLLAILTNDNTFTGTTTVNGGTLEARGNTGRAIGSGAAFVNPGGTLLVTRPNAIGNAPVTLNGAASVLRFNTGGTTTSTAATYAANEGSLINVTGGSTVNLPNATLSMTGAGTFFGLREGWVRTNNQFDPAVVNPNNGINGGVVTNIRMASITARTGGTAAGVDNPGPANNFAWSDNTTFYYTGQIQARVTGFMQFAEQIDDRVYVNFAGAIETGGVNNHGVEWFRPTSTRAIPVVAGQWYDFEVRIAQGGGGAGPPGSNANGGWGAGWTNTYGFGLSEVAVGDGLIGAATSIADSTSNPKYIGTNYFKPGEAGDPLFDAVSGTQTRFRATTTAAFLNIDAGSTFSVGRITGGGFITLTGTGGVGASFTLSNAASATASSAGQVTYAGDSVSAFTVGTNQTLTLAGGITTPAAALTFIKSGSGNMTVNGPTNFGAGSTYRIDGGTVRFNGTGTGTGAVAVQTGAVIGGSGTVPGAVTLATGAGLSPGNSVGKLSTGAMTIGAGSTYFFEYSSDNQATINGSPVGTFNDAVAVTGTLALPNVANGLTINIQPFGFTPPLNGTPVDYTLATATTITGFAANNFQFTGLGFSGTPQVLLQGGNTLILRITPVPEPASVLLVCAGAAGAAGWWRRRKSGKA